MFIEDTISNYLNNFFVQNIKLIQMTGISLRPNWVTINQMWINMDII